MLKQKAVSFVSLLDRENLNYSSIWEMQKSFVDEVVSGARPETILFCEHESVITCGRRATEKNILDASIPVYEVERGGDVTLHSPGQLVIYPLLKLNEGRFVGGLHEYLRFCEEIIIQTLKGYGLRAGRFGPTGVWIENEKSQIKKIASIGVAVRRWVTYHGISLNVSNDLNEFNRIRPCNFESSIMTSLNAEGVNVSLSEVLMNIQERMTAYWAQLPVLQESASYSPDVQPLHKSIPSI